MAVYEQPPGVAVAACLSAVAYIATCRRVGCITRVTGDQVLLRRLRGNLERITRLCMNTFYICISSLNRNVFVFFFCPWALVQRVFVLCGLFLTKCIRFSRYECLFRLGCTKTYLFVDGFGLRASSWLLVNLYLKRVDFVRFWSDFSSALDALLERASFLCWHLMLQVCLLVRARELLHV